MIAWTAQTKNVFGDVPLNKYALSGTPFDLRGYYMGQYRDKSSHVIMGEYRQMFNTDKSTWIKKMVSHIGFHADDCITDCFISVTEIEVYKL